MASYGVALVLALFVASCIGQACDIEGTWVATETAVGVAATYTFEFNGDGRFALEEVKEYSSPTCDGEYTFNGRYTLSSSEVLRLTVSSCHQSCFGDCGNRCPACSTDPLTTVVNFSGDCSSFNMGSGNLYYSRQASDSVIVQSSDSSDSTQSSGGSDWWVFTLIALASTAVLCGAIAVVMLAVVAIVFFAKKAQPSAGNRDEFDY